MLCSARVECDILLYTRVNADRKWVIIGPSTDTTQKFLFHKGWNILRYMYIFAFSDCYFPLLVYDFCNCRNRSGIGSWAVISRETRNLASDGARCCIFVMHLQKVVVRLS